MPASAATVAASTESASGTDHRLDCTHCGLGCRIDCARVDSGYRIGCACVGYRLERTSRLGRACRGTGRVATRLRGDEIDARRCGTSLCRSPAGRRPHPFRRDRHQSQRHAFCHLVEGPRALHPHVGFRRRRIDPGRRRSLARRGPHEPEARCQGAGARRPPAVPESVPGRHGQQGHARPQRTDRRRLVEDAARPACRGGLGRLERSADRRRREPPAGARSRACGRAARSRRSRGTRGRREFGGNQWPRTQGTASARRLDRPDEAAAHGPRRAGFADAGPARGGERRQRRARGAALALPDRQHRADEIEHRIRRPHDAAARAGRDPRRWTSRSRASATISASPGRSRQQARSTRAGPSRPTGGSRSNRSTWRCA